MTTNFTAVEKTYWVAFNDEGVVHKGELEPGRSVSTGLEHFESFTRRRPGWRGWSRSVRPWGRYDPALASHPGSAPCV